MANAELISKPSYPVLEGFALVGVGKSMGYKLIAAGELESFKVGKRRFLTARGISRFIDKRLAADARARGREIPPEPLSTTGRPAQFFASGKRVGRPPKARASPASP